MRAKREVARSKDGVFVVHSLRSISGLQEGRKDGRTDGRQEGRKDGRKEGRTEGREQ